MTSSHDERYVYISHSFAGGYYKVGSELTSITMSDGNGCWKSLIPVACFECGQRCHDNPPKDTVETWFCDQQCAWSWLYRTFYIFEDLSE